MRGLLALVLVLWEPLNFAVKALAVLPTITYRGWLSALELLMIGIVAAINAAAGLALMNRTSASHRLAVVAVLASCARMIQSVSYSTLPSETVPGQEPYVVIAALTFAIVGLAIIRRSARSSR